MRSGVLWCVLAACGSAPTHEVDFDLVGAGSAMITYHDGDGTWHAPARPDANHMELTVTDDYEVIVVCLTGGNSYESEFAAVVDDGPTWTWDMDCDDGGPSIETVQVTGSMDHIGRVFIEPFLDSTATSLTAPWSYNFNVAPGTYDLVAVGEDSEVNERIVIQRDLAIEAPTTEPDIDLVAQGSIMTPITISVGGMAPYSQIVATTSLTTTHTLATIATDTDGGALTATTTTTMVKTVPASLLEPTDTETLDLLVTVPSAGTPEVERAAHVTFTGAETSFELLPPAASLTFDATGAATWSPIASSGGIELSVESACLNPCTPTTMASQTLKATKSWLEIHGGNTVGFDTSPPGFQPTWAVDLSMPFVRTFTVWDDATAISYATSIEALSDGSASRVAHRTHTSMPFPTDARAVPSLARPRSD